MTQDQDFHVLREGLHPVDADQLEGATCQALEERQGHGPPSRWRVLAGQAQQEVLAPFNRPRVRTGSLTFNTGWRDDPTRVVAEPAAAEVHEVVSSSAAVVL